MHKPASTRNPNRVPQSSQYHSEHSVFSGHGLRSLGVAALAGFAAFSPLSPISVGKLAHDVKTIISPAKPKQTSQYERFTHLTEEAGVPVTIGVTIDPLRGNVVNSVSEAVYAADMPKGSHPTNEQLDEVIDYVVDAETENRTGKVVPEQSLVIPPVIAER